MHNTTVQSFQTILHNNNNNNNNKQPLDQSSRSRASFKVAHTPIGLSTKVLLWQISQEELTQILKGDIIYIHTQTKIRSQLLRGSPKSAQWCIVGLHVVNNLVALWAAYPGQKGLRGSENAQVSQKARIFLVTY